MLRDNAIFLLRLGHFGRFLAFARLLTDLHDLNVEMNF